MTDIEAIKRPKVFISYSWTPEDDKERVKEIADRLVSDCGIEVLLDRYDLQPGDDKYVYMEKMVTDDTINKVLIFSNKDYAEKSNVRKGGVGTESTIISQEVYGKVNQNKFIPVLLEKDASGEPYLPTYIKSRLHFDFSDIMKFEDEFERLVRFLYNKPLDKKPALGSIPPYILETDQAKIRVHYKVERFKNAILEGKRNLGVLIEDYFVTFITDISEMRIENDTRIDVPIDEKVYDIIVKMKSHRDSFLEFYEALITLDTQVYLDLLHKHIEKWDEILVFKDNYNRPEKEKINVEHYKFLFKEIFLYIITIALNKYKYEILDYLLNTPYWVKDNYGENIDDNYTFLFYALPILDKERCNRLYKDAETHPKSIATDMLINEERIYKNITIKQLKETDIFLYYVSGLQDKGHWFPYLVMYGTGILSFMRRAEYKNVFEQMKPIFKVNDIDELKSKIEKIQDHRRKYYDRSYHIEDIFYALNVDRLATK